MMNESLYIRHHLCLGDSIICNGLVRTYTEKYNEIFLFVKPQTIENVSYMYRDNKKIKFIVLDDAGIDVYIEKNGNNNYLIVGYTPQFFQNTDNGTYKSFDYGFYAMANIPYEDRWNKFYFLRNTEKENDAYYNKMGLKDNEEYLFIHEDATRNRILNPKNMPSGIKLIKTSDFKDVGVFDFLYTIERAKEVHIIDSCFLALIDNMQLDHNKLFVHINNVRYPTALKLNWNVYYE